MCTNRLPKRTFTIYMPGIILHSLTNDLHHLDRFKFASITREEDNCVTVGITVKLHS